MGIGMIVIAAPDADLTDLAAVGAIQLGSVATNAERKVDLAL